MLECVPCLSKPKTRIVSLKNTVFKTHVVKDNNIKICQKIFVENDCQIFINQTLSITISKGEAEGKYYYLLYSTHTLKRTNMYFELIVKKENICICIGTLLIGMMIDDG